MLEGRIRLPGTAPRIRNSSNCAKTSFFLERTSPNSHYLDSIKFAALSCRQPLEQFLHKIKKYEPSLGVGHKASTARSTTDKLRRTFGKKEEVQKLQGYLNLHVTTIDMLLMEHGLATITIAAEETKADNLYIRERLDQTRSVLSHVKGSVEGQQIVVQATQSLLARLFEMVSGEFRTSWKSLGDMVAKVSQVSHYQYLHELYLTPR